MTIRFFQSPHLAQVFGGRYGYALLASILMANCGLIAGESATADADVHPAQMLDLSLFLSKNKSERMLLSISSQSKDIAISVRSNPNIRFSMHVRSIDKQGKETSQGYQEFEVGRNQHKRPDPSSCLQIKPGESLTLDVDKQFSDYLKNQSLFNHDRDITLISLRVSISGVLFHLDNHITSFTADDLLMANFYSDYIDLDADYVRSRLKEIQ